MTRFIFLFIALAACSPTYTCGDFPEAVCQSVSETYAQNQSADSQDSRAVSATTLPGQVIVTAPDMAPSPNHAALGVDPFLTRPLLLRILLTPWEDKQHDLHGGGYVYIRLEDSKWVFPK